MGFEARSRRTVGLALALGSILAPAVASAADRVALVVGNGAYAAIGSLPNPENDAADMTAALGRLGFDVTTVRDADRLAMTEALRVFTRESAGADVSLVFYAGHGLEMNGVNYLVPVDARLERDTDVRFEALTLEDVLASTAGAGLRVVILDACRNNPLARSMPSRPAQQAERAAQAGPPPRTPPASRRPAGPRSAPSAAIAAVVCCAAAPGATMPSTSGLARASGLPPPAGTPTSVFAFRGRWIDSLPPARRESGVSSCAGVGAERATIAGGGP